MPTPPTRMLRGAILLLALSVVWSSEAARASRLAEATEKATTEGVVQLLPFGGAPISIRVEVAKTPESRARGLMFREKLREGWGMLFLFPEQKRLSFWMRNTQMPLDILFLASDGTILNIHENTTPYAEESLPSAGPAQYVLEVPGGFSAKMGVRPRDRVELGTLAHLPAH